MCRFGCDHTLAFSNFIRGFFTFDSLGGPQQGCEYLLFHNVKTDGIEVIKLKIIFVYEN